MAAHVQVAVFVCTRTQSGETRGYHKWGAEPRTSVPTRARGGKVRGHARARAFAYNLLDCPG
jgi:hypothetical protein